MDEYIKREVAIEDVNSLADFMSVSTSIDMCLGMKSMKSRALSALKDIPAADVRPVVRGKWIQTTQPMGWRDEDCAECSVCGEDFVLDEWAMDEFTNLMNFCPNCGADMRGEQDATD